MRYAKFGAQNDVGSRRLTSTSRPVIRSERTNPRSVIGSSSSGSTTAPSAAYASSWRFTSGPDQMVRCFGDVLGATRADRGFVCSRQPQLRRDRDVVHLRRVEAEDFLLLLGSDRRVLAEIGGDMES